MKKLISILLSVSLMIGTCGFNAVTADDDTGNTVTDTIYITADKTAQWISNASDSKSYDLKIHGWENWETAAYIGFTLPEDFEAEKIANAKLVVNTKSAKVSGTGRVWEASYGFTDGDYKEGVDQIIGYTHQSDDDILSSFDTPVTTGDFEINITEYMHNLSADKENVAFRIDAVSGQINMDWNIGSCKSGTAPKLVVTEGVYIAPTPKPTEEPMIEPEEKVLNQFVNLDFSAGLDGWTTSKSGETVGKVTADNGTVVMGNKSSLYQTANGLAQGSYTMNVWVKGTATGNTSYIKAEKTGGPVTESKIDTFINNSSYTCISLRNVLVYNGQCRIKIFSGKGCELVVDKIEFVMDSNDENPVNNWGFESGLDNWETNGGVEITDDCDTGNNAVKLAPSSQISQTIRVKPNTKYFATVRAKVDTQDTWHTVFTTYGEDNYIAGNVGKKSGEYSVTDTNGDRINLGVKNADGVVLRQAPAGLEGWSLLTISFVTGENDNEVTLYANTIYDKAYQDSVKVYGDGATGDAWSGNTGNAYIDSFDVFTREEDVVLGADISYLPLIEDNNGKYYANGVQQDFMRILSNRGVTTVNGMIFVDGGAPAYIANSSTIASSGGTPYVMPNGFDKYYWYGLAERAKELNMDFMVNFHFTDIWGNAQNGFISKHWLHYDKETGAYNLGTLDELKTTMYTYVYDFMSGLKELGITPIAVKIGNEEDNGICYPLGQFDRWSAINNGAAIEGFRDLVNAAYDASHDVFPDISASIHTYQGYSTSYSKSWFDTMAKNGVKFDARAYSLYGASPTYNLLAMINQDNNENPYQDTIHVETGYQATYYNADNLGNDTTNVQSEYWSPTPNGQYNYILEYLQAFKDLPNPHSVMRGMFWWAAEWMEVDGAGWMEGDGNTVAGRTLVNIGDVDIHEPGSSADGKAGDVYESTYAYLWRGAAKNKASDAINPLRRYGTYSVTALDAPEKISMDEENVTLREGEFKKLHTTLAPTNAVYNWNVIWSSSDENVAVVGDSGTVKAVGSGTAIITATTEAGGKTAICTVTVNPSVKAKKDEIGINVNAYDMALNDGGKIGMLTDGTLKLEIDLPDEVTNKSVKITSENPAVIRFWGENYEPDTKKGTEKDTRWIKDYTDIVKKGILYQQTGNTDEIELLAVGSGESVVTVSALDGNVSKSFTVNVTDTADAQPEKIIINKTEVEIEKTFTEKLSAAVYPQNALYGEIEWQSSDTSVAAVDKNGKITAVGVGTAVITAKTGNVSASCNVTVTPTTQVEKVISGITPDDNDVYYFTSGESMLTADFRVDAGKVTIEFDVQLLQINGGKYTKFDINDSNGNSIIHWGCYEYNDGSNTEANQLKVGNYEASGFENVSNGITLGKDASTAYTHFKAVIDFDENTAVLYAGDKKLGEGTIDAENAAKLEIFSNHNARTISVKNISIINETAEDTSIGIKDFNVNLDTDGVLNYEVTYIGNDTSKVYVAVYNKSGELIRCLINASGSVRFDENGEYTIKAFLWDDMNPIANAAEKTVEYR